MTLGKVVSFFSYDCDTGVLLVSNGIHLCDIIRVRSDNSREYI